MLWPIVRFGMLRRKQLKDGRMVSRMPFRILFLVTLGSRVHKPRRLLHSGSQFAKAEGRSLSVERRRLKGVIWLPRIDMAALSGPGMTSWPEMQPMPNNLVNYGVTDNGIAIIELCSDSAGEPLTEGKTPVNTYTHAMMRDEAVLKARFDDDVTVILLTGYGEKFFSAGASISMLDSVSPGFKYFFCLHANETLSRLEQTPKLVIAALNGHAVGGGLEIAMSADIRIGRKDSVKSDFQRSLWECLQEPVALLGLLA